MDHYGLHEKDLITATVHSKIDEEAKLLDNVSQEIWHHPELNFEEKFAHDLLCKVLVDQGFQVQKHYCVDTAFRAEFSNRNPGPTVAVLCEYDALPVVGHACGHNLIAESGIAAGLAIKAAMKAYPSIPGKVVVLGTPAEEGGGGKICLINKDAFKDIDIAIMVHPSPHDYLYTPFISIGRVVVTFTGKEAHASGYAWEGINALDAAVASYNNVSMLRQQMKPTWRVHGIISKGGDIPNVIPGLTEVHYYYRAPSTKEMDELKQKLESCFKSAAISTGCQVDIKYDNASNYESLVTNKILVELYQKYAVQMGIKFCDDNPKVIPFVASSDVGNVSRVVPSIQPTFSIGTTAATHSVAFAEAAKRPEAQAPTLIAGKAMALLALEVMCSPPILKEIKKQFLSDLKDDH